MLKKKCLEQAKPNTAVEWYIDLPTHLRSLIHKSR